MSKLVLDKCIGKRMVSRNLSHQYQNCNINQLLIFGRYHKV